MDLLNITIIQTHIQWENPKANQLHFQEIIQNIHEETHLIILPEMFLTGFSMNISAFAEDMNGPSIAWMVKMAQMRHADITGSLVIKDQDNYYNRLVWVKPNGNILTYDKRHLFPLGKEHTILTKGNHQLKVDLHGWIIQPMICYDLRFPVWSRQNQTPYDVAIYIANWPQARVHHWITLLQARAIENQAYVIGVNRIGIDGMDLNYSGDSCLVDPSGKLLYSLDEFNGHKTISLNKRFLTILRKTFPFLSDGDHFSID